MSVKIRLARGGTKKRPYYRLVIADIRAPRDGRYIERVGIYDPMLPKDSPDRVKLNMERIKHWISKGAKPTDRVGRFINAEDASVWAWKVSNNPNKAKPGTKAIELLAEKAEKAEARKEAEAQAKEDAKAAKAAAAEAAKEAAATAKEEAKAAKEAKKDEKADDKPAEDKAEAKADDKPAEEKSK